MKYVYRYAPSYLHTSLRLMISIFILLSPLQTLLYYLDGRNFSGVTIMGSALFPIFWVWSTYSSYVGFALSAIYITDIGVTEVENKATTVEWDNIQEIKLIRHGPCYYNAFIKIYDVRKDNPTKRIAVRIGRNRENYQHAWATVINEIKTKKPGIVIPMTLIKEMERIQNGVTV